MGLLLTRQCNLACTYCNVITKPDQGTLSVSEWCAIIDKFLKYRHRHFVITGGEPLLYNGVHDIIRHASQKAIVSLITNGILLTPGSLEELKGLDYLTVSFDRLDPDNTDGKNLTDKLEMIKEAVRRYRFTVETITTITKENMAHVPDIIELSLRAGFNALISVIHAKREGDSRIFEFRNDNPDLVPESREDYMVIQAMVDRLLELKKIYPNFVERKSFIRGIPNFLKGDFKMDCFAGESYFEINNDGRIMACHDTPQSSVHALFFDDYAKMKKTVKRKIAPGCSCYYNCFYNYAVFKKKPVRFTLELAGQQLSLVKYHTGRQRFFNR